MSRFSALYNTDDLCQSMQDVQPFVEQPPMSESQDVRFQPQEQRRSDKKKQWLLSRTNRKNNNEAVAVQRILSAISESQDVRRDARFQATGHPRPKQMAIEEKKTKELPIVPHIPKIIDLVKRNRVVFVSASTGSGKSTCVPPEIAKSDPNFKVLVVSPTVISCIRLKQTVQERHPGLVVGKACGGIVEYDERTQLAFATAGHVKLLLARTRSFEHFNVIVIDEAHVRSVEYEILTALCHYLYHSVDVKFVIMTATLDPAILDAWQNVETSFVIPKVEIDVVLFPITSSFETNDEDISTKMGMDNLQSRTLAKIIEQDKLQPAGHFLVFCPGQDMIDEMYDLLLTIHEQGKISAECKIFRAFSSLPNEELEIAFQQTIPSDFARSIILSTDVAETSVTIPGVVYVLDMGLQKQMNFGVLEQVRISYFSAIQRRGRTGRTGKGHVHRMYSENVLDHLDKVYPPALLRTHLYQPILELLVHKLSPFDVLVPFSDLPPSHIQTCIDRLVKNKLVYYYYLEEDEKHDGITNLRVSDEAVEIASLPIDLELGKVLYMVKRSDDPNLLTLVALVVSICQLESGGGASLIYFPRRAANESNWEYSQKIAEYRQIFRVFEVDSSCSLHTAVNVYVSFLQQVKHRGQAGAWCRDNGINNKTLSALTALLSRLDRFAKGNLVYWNREAISQVFARLVPFFFQVFGEERLYQRRGDKWFCHATDPQNELRCFMNTRGFHYDLPECGQALVINISQIQNSGENAHVFNNYFTIPRGRTSDKQRCMKKMFIKEEPVSEPHDQHWRIEPALQTPRNQTHVSSCAARCA